MSCGLATKQLANGTQNQIIVAGASVPAWETVGGDATLAGGTLTVVSASTTVAGKIEIATQAEVDAGTDTVRAVTPDTLANTTLGFPPSGAAGGDLAGTYPNPTIATGAVDEAELNNIDGGVDAQSFVLTSGYAASAGTVAGGDTIEAALQKIDGNVAAVAAGLSWKDAAIAASTQDLASESFGSSGVTYANGTAGVGATLTQDVATDGAFGSIDGVSAVQGQRYVIKNQSTGAENGIYELTEIGNGSTTPWVLTRVTDADVSAELDGASIFVQQGTASQDLAFVQTADAPTIGTTALSFTQFSSTLTLGGTPNTIEPDDAASAGVGTTAARFDHEHAIAAAAAGTIEPDDTAAEGTATSFARSDHQHAIAAGTAGASAPGDTAAEGSSTSFARADHTHGRESFTMEDVTTQNISGTDTAITDTLDNTPDTWLGLFLNGQLLIEGASGHYTRSGTTLTWLGSTGCGIDLATTDRLQALYAY